MVTVRRTLAAAGALATALLFLEIALRVLTRGGSFSGVPLLPLDAYAPARAARAIDFKTSYLTFDDALGWTVGSSRRSANGLYRSTPFGARWSGEGAPPAEGAVVWATAFGDSFTHGDDVPWDATWTSLLSKRKTKEIVNFGVPGYGVDQALLRFRKLGPAWPSSRVLIGFMADNIGRHLNRYRPFLSPSEQLFFAKPRFKVRGDALELLPQPFHHLEGYFAPEAAGWFEALKQDDFWYRAEDYERRPSDAWRTARVLRSVLADRRRRQNAWRGLYADRDSVDLTRRILLEFARAVRAPGREPTVIFFPDQTLCHDAIAGRPNLAGPLLSSLRDEGVPVVDLTKPLSEFLRGKPFDRYFIPHYSRELNQIVARVVAADLDQ